MSDDKLTGILSPPGNLWHNNCTHTPSHTHRVNVKHAESWKLIWNYRPLLDVFLCGNRLGSGLLDDCFPMTDEQRNSFNKGCSTAALKHPLTPVYTPLMCRAHFCIIMRGTAAFSSSLKGHYGMRKPSWPKAKYIICLFAPGEHT